MNKMLVLSRSSWKRAAIVGAVLAACAGIAWAIRPAADHRETLPDPEPTRAVIMVTAEPVAIRSVQRTIDTVGTLHGYEDVVLSAKVDGRVKAVHHDVSDRVPPGELVIEFDRVDMELALQQAERSLLVELAKLGVDKMPDAEFDFTTVPTVAVARARLDNAEVKRRRGQVLAQSRALSAEDLDNLDSEFRAAKAEVANQMLQAKATLATAQLRAAAVAVAAQQLKDTEIRVPTPTFELPEGMKDPSSPIQYAVAQRSVAEGTYVRAGSEVCRLVIDRALKLRTPVPDRHTADVRVGQPVSVTTAAAETPTAGTVVRINPTVDTKNRTFEVEILVPNMKRELRPGSFAKAVIVAKHDPNAATVPLTSLVTFAGITKIFVMEGDRVRSIPVRLGVQTTEWAEIASPPVPADAVVLTSGHRSLADGARVEIRDNR